MSSYEKSTLYIPANIKTRQEFFEGFGFSEFLKTLMATAVSLCISLIIYSQNHSVATVVLFILISIAGSVVAVTKDRNNQSMVDYVSHMIRFAREQQRYHYRIKEGLYD